MRGIFIVAKRGKIVDSFFFFFFFFFFFVRNITTATLLYSPVIKFTPLLFRVKEYFHFHFYFIIGKYAGASNISN